MLKKLDFIETNGKVQLRQTGQSGILKMDSASPSKFLCRTNILGSDYEKSYIEGKQNLVAVAWSRKFSEIHIISSEAIRSLMTMTKVQISTDAIKVLAKEYRSHCFFRDIYESTKQPFNKRDN